MELTAEAEDALVALLVVRQGLMPEAKVERALARAAAASRRLVDHLAAGGALSKEQLDAVVAALDPEVVPGYRIEGEAGRGGMGVVFRARQLSMDRPVALKVLSRSLSEDASYVAKFLAEARSAAKLNHENVVAAIDAGEADGLYYFVMELIDGPSVADLLDEEPLPWERAFSIAEQVARGLRHAHEVGIVHRDVKPENVMIAADQTVKLCDLGLAKPLQPAGTGEKEAMTEGTPYYCSPEQALGRTDIDARSDVYSLGATLFHMLTGDPPFDGDSARAILVKQVKKPFPDLAEALPDVPEPLRDLLGAMVVKDREERLPDMRAFEERLAAARQGPARAAPPDTTLVSTGPPWIALAVIAGLALVLAAAIPWGGGPETADPPPAVADGDPATPEPTDGPGVGVETHDPPPDEPPEAVPPSPLERASAEAADYRQAHPEDVWGAQERYRALIAQDPAGSVAESARLALAELEAEGARRGKEALDRLATQVLELTRQRRFRSALELCETFRTTWAPRPVPGLPERVNAIADATRRGGAATATQALAALHGAALGGPEQEAAEALARELPDRDADRLRVELDAWRKEQARVRWEAVLSRYRAALYAGEFAAAAAVLDGIDPAQATGPTVPELRQELEGIQRVDQVFVGTWLALTDQEVELTFAAEPTRTGRLVRFEPDTWSIELEQAGGARSRHDLRELAPEELVRRALPAREGRANALYFLGHAAPAAAHVALAAAVAAGRPDDPGLRQAILARRREAADALGAAWVDRWTGTGLEPDLQVAALGAASETIRRSAAYRERFADVVASYRAARQAQLEARPEALFGGRIEDGRRGRLTIVYDFQTPAQLRDWQPDRLADPSSKIEPLEGGGVGVWGKVNLRGRFDDGELKVELRAVPLDLARPNLNVVIAGGPGWRGLLCGGGYAPPNVLKVQGPPRGSRRGADVDLPANVVADLPNRLPGDLDAVLAEGTWSASHPDEEVRILVQRSSRGSLRFKVDGRVVSLKGADEAAAPGIVALAPLGGGLRLIGCEVTGRLEESWLQRAPVELAAQEAASLPRPIP